jgi:hypothetical protein
MLTRRQLLSTVISGSAAFIAGASAAQAFSEQPMPPAVAAEYALGCSTIANHDQLVQTARSSLLDKITRGLMPANAEEIVTCPICGCRMVVTASN